MSEDRAADVRRAREVLNGAGWVFDKFVNDEMAKILKSARNAQERENNFMRARVATELKGALLAVVEAWDFETKQAERREKKEK